MGEVAGEVDENIGMSRKDKEYKAFCDFTCCVELFYFADCQWRGPVYAISKASYVRQYHPATRGCIGLSAISNDDYM